MKHVTRILVLLSLVLPMKSFASFNSKEDLLLALAKTGFGYVIAIPGGNSNPDVRVYSYDNGHRQEESLSSFAKTAQSEKARPELNYVNNNQRFLGLEKKLIRTTYDLAYQVNDVLLCYKSSPKSNTYVDCYVFPRNIDEVIYALKAARQIK